MEAAESDSVEPTNMDKSPETRRQLQLPEQKPMLPIGEYFTLVRGDETIRTLLVKTDDPQDPFEAIDPGTKEKIEMDRGEKLEACARFGVEPPSNLLKIPSKSVQVK